MKTHTIILVGIGLSASFAAADLKLPTIIGDHMVLQQKQVNPLWGWDAPGTEVTVQFGAQTKTAKAGSDGKWTVKLDPLDANAVPANLVIRGSSTVNVADVLVGEVWMCSGQSNMGFDVNGDWNAEVETLASNHPNLRLISVPQVGTQELQDDFKGQWAASTPESCKNFSAVGFFYGRFLHEILGVPVGLIDNSWGGSAAEAWVRRDTIEGDPRFAALMEGWRKREADLNSEESLKGYEEALAKWEADSAAAAKAGERPPRRPQNPKQILSGNQRPGNIFAGVVHPTLTYGIKGVIWYQGESNAGRAWEYAQLFPFMIEQWRKEWGQGDFPFYWVQLADYMAEKSEPGESAWAELRASQTKTLELPNTGEAVIIDLGEANDIHPKNKYDVAARLVRWALAKNYGKTMEPQSPTFKSHQVDGNKLVLHFEHTGGGLRTVDVNEVSGFAICGEDRKWVWADAKIVENDTIALSSANVPNPVAARYAWADNPVCNVYARNGLPLTPFRTDDFPMTTQPK